MKPLIPPSYYSDPVIFAREMEVLFQGSWQFVGFIFDLPNHNDFLTREIGGKSVFIQNFNGELKAFSNVCAHRFNRLRHEESGNGPVRCGYHGWVYDGSGAPVGIPKKHLFASHPEEALTNLCLQSWALETCGTFVFITRSCPQSLADFLGPETYRRLEVSSNAFGERLDAFEFHVEANWKLVIENGLDSYHVEMVHGGTFMQLGTPEYSFDWKGRHTTVRATTKCLSDKDQRRMNRENGVYEYCLRDRALKENHFEQRLVFPNFLLTSFRGATFVVQEVLPSRPGQSEIRTQVFFTRLPELDAGPKAAAQAIAASNKPFLRKIGQEDLGILAENYKGVLNLRDGEMPGIFSQDEIRAWSFHKEYLTVVGTPELLPCQ